MALLSEIVGAANSFSDSSLVFIAFSKAIQALQDILATQTKVLVEGCYLFFGENILTGVNLGSTTMFPEPTTPAAVCNWLSTISYDEYPTRFTSTWMIS